ncbi:precorrin-2 C(20)-methyltransferase [Synechococcus sp. PCC 7336]|uniref:precorrin-2 C(20)-methyltransferase n=1 Tax=Synechococcus sp. PCC 7336 TaxID=195250 RepID=UPI000347F5C3|nr:precorrin-2 C(20)-methyltransferase [Synechococcus sp. PCC 7336]
MDKSFGTLWGVSVGPGRADWLTIAARHVLEDANAIACPQDRQGNPGMAYRIVREFLSGNRKILALDMPFVQDSATLTAAWDRAAAELLAILNCGGDVAFIAEGDVSFYSTFTHLARTVNERSPHIPIEVIPGVCSPLAAAAALKMPLSTWDEKVAIVPAMHGLEELERALDWADVVVLMKVAPVFDRVWQMLRERGLLAEAGLVEWLGWPRQKVFGSLAGLQDYRPPYFSMVIVRSQPMRFGRLDLDLPVL